MRKMQLLIKGNSKPPDIVINLDGTVISNHSWGGECEGGGVVGLGVRVVLSRRVGELLAIRRQWYIQSHCIRFNQGRNGCRTSSAAGGFPERLKRLSCHHSHRLDQPAS